MWLSQLKNRLAIPYGTENEPGTGFQISISLAEFYKCIWRTNVIDFENVKIVIVVRF